MEGLQGSGAAPTVTLVLMQACEDADPSGGQQQGNPAVPQGTLEIQQCTLELQPDPSGMQQQGSLELQQGSLIMQQQGNLDLQQGSLDLQQGSLIMQQQGSLELQQGSLIMQQQGSLELQQGSLIMQQQGSLELQRLTPAMQQQQGSPDLQQQGSLELLQTSQGTLELAGIRVYYSMVTPGDDELEDESEDPLETSDPRDSTASPEELELVLDEEYNSGDNENVIKNCTYPDCSETCSQGAKQRKPWMCKKHRNKMYKDKYKKKKSDQAMTCTSGKLEESADLCSIAIAKQRTGVSVGERPSRPTLLEQVLNQKRLSLLRSPEVVQFLQAQQQLLSQQVCEQRQPFQGAPL